jgi:nitric oxide reductase NorD protein
MTSSARSSREALVGRLTRLVPELEATLARADDGERWLDLLAGLDEAAPRLVDGCARGSLPWLGRVPVETLTAWVAAGRALARGGGWRAERRARAFFDAPHAMTILDPELLAPWSALAVRFGKALDDARYFELLASELAGWTPEERAAFLAVLAAVVARDPRAATVLYRDLPRELGVAPPPLRAVVLAALAAAGPAVDPAALAGVQPVLGALLASVAPARRAVAATTLRTIAGAAPGALVGLVRSLPRIVELAPDDERVAEWVRRGLAIAAESADAGVAYFALASRTSERILLASPTAAQLAEVQGELRKFVQMLSGAPAVPNGVGGFHLRPALEREPEQGGVTLPDVVDVLATYEDNLRLFRLLAALVAGRREVGTYAEPALLDRLEAEGEPSHLPDLVCLTDGYRVARRLARRYPGLAREVAWGAERVLGRATAAERPSFGPLLDAVLALALADDAARRAVPVWLATVAAPALAALRPLDAEDATIDDAVAAARRLAPLFAFAREPDAAAGVLADLLPLLLEDDGEPYAAEDGPAPAAGAGDDGGATEADVPPGELPDDLRAELEALLGPEGPGVQTISPEELARLLAAGLLAKLKQSRGAGLDETGLYVTRLLGKVLGDTETPELLERGGVGAGRASLPRDVDAASAVFTYDEWDHRIGDYRPRWCRLREIPVADDAGVFWEKTLARHARLVPEIRRHFQRVRPELYRVLRQLEDGEDFDLGALVDARAELRARRTPSAKLYTRRVRQERDVATLFLVDLSASTDEQASPESDERIIDVTREALVLMAAALDEIGDAFAIYGFSGQGRDNVELFAVKGFDERLTPGVKGRIGGLEPRGSTRMGTALRHAITKMRALPQPSRHLILLSDGFPQDLDYGDDRHSHTYGIRDTATALREAQAAGIRPFCITVDAAGHDYLRDMCSPNAYMVIDDVGDLPEELPKIYQRLVRAA